MAEGREEEEKEGQGGIKTKVPDNVSGSYYFYLKLCARLHNLDREREVTNRWTDRRNLLLNVVKQNNLLLNIGHGSSNDSLKNTDYIYSLWLSLRNL